MKRPRRRNDAKAAMDYSIAWYAEKDYDLIRDLSVDADQMEPTYDDWLRNATQVLGRLERLGLPAKKVAVDCEGLIRWCRAEGRALNGEARAAYSAYLAEQAARNRAGRQSPPGRS